MKPFDNSLFSVDFSLPCTAIAPYVKRAADIFGARVTLAHVFDLGSSSGLELYVRPFPEVLRICMKEGRTETRCIVINREG